MRKYLLIVVALLAVLVGAPKRAGADLPVIDFSGAVDRLKSFLQDLKAYATELEQYTTQLRQLQEAVQEVMWVTNIANGLIHNPNLGQVMALMNLVGIDNPLPVNPYAVQSLLSGYRGNTGVEGLMGKLNNLGSLTTTAYSNSQVYNCTDGSFACQQQQYRATGNAGLLGMAGKVYQDLNNHLQTLQGLQGKVGTTVDLKDAADVANALHIEQAWLANSNAQITAIAAMAAAQRDVSSTQGNQRLFESIDAVIRAAPH